jgi:thiol-disulfide isomerase/thioredoxin
MQVSKSVNINKKTSVFLCVLCGGITFLLLAACGDNGAVTGVTPETGGEPQTEIVKVGRAAPDFAATDANGQTVKLSDFKGKPVMVNFWATWCAPCQYEMPELKAAYQQYQGQGLVIVGVNLGEQSATVKKYLQEKDYSWPNVLDPNGTIKSAYNVIGYPTSIFIDREGIVRATQIGGLDKDFLAEKLQTIF